MEFTKMNRLFTVHNNYLMYLITIQKLQSEFDLLDVTGKYGYSKLQVEEDSKVEW